MYTKLLQSQKSEMSPEFLRCKMLGLLEPGQASPEQHMTDEGVTCVTDHLVHVGHIN